MTIYVFDSGPLITIFRHYYPARFPTLWQQFDDMISNNHLTSTREVRNELEGYGDRLSDWCKQTHYVFPTPDSKELAIVRNIFEVEHFQQMIRYQERQQGKPVADPFVIARAKTLSEGCVVTAELFKPNAAQIPNICRHFEVDCVDLAGFMERENWSF